MNGDSENMRPQLLVLRCVAQLGRQPSSFHLIIFNVAPTDIHPHTYADLLTYIQAEMSTASVGAAAYQTTTKTPSKPVQAVTFDFIFMHRVGLKFIQNYCIRMTLASSL